MLCIAGNWCYSLNLNWADDIAHYAFHGKNINMLSKWVIKSPGSYEKITDNFEFFSNIVKTKISKNITEFTFSCDMHHIIIM